MAYKTAHLHWVRMVFTGRQHNIVTHALVGPVCRLVHRIARHSDQTHLKN